MFAFAMIASQMRTQHRWRDRLTGSTVVFQAETAELPPTPKGRATRERLLTAATAIFEQHGYDAARVADIVAGAGVSHGLFYRHFADKDAILLAVLTRLYDGLRHTSGRGTATGGKPTLAQLQARNILFFSEYAQHRRMLRVSREAAGRAENAGFRALWLEMRGRFTVRTVRWLNDLAAAGHIEPLNDAAMIAEGLSSMTEQMAYVQLGLATEEPSDDLIERLGHATGVIWHRTIFGNAA